MHGAHGESHTSTSLLVGNNLPVHDPITNLLKRKAKLEEMNIIKKHATLPRTSNKVMVNDIAQNILSSSHPNALYSMSTTNALKLALYRKKKKLHPLSTSAPDISGGDEVSHPSLPHQYYGWL
jgi:hypothetical protein